MRARETERDAWRGTQDQCPVPAPLLRVVIAENGGIPQIAGVVLAMRKVHHPEIVFHLSDSAQNSALDKCRGKKFQPGLK
jgi:hypothetical protein